MVAKVKDILPIIQYTASAGQTVFPYPFPVFASGDIVVLVDSVAQSEGTDYTVSGVELEDGGDITFTSGRSANEIVTIYRDMAFDRLVDYQNNGDFLSSTVNDDYDRIWLALQQLKEVDSRTIKFGEEDTGKTSVIDTSQTGKLIGLDQNGNIFYYSAASDVETDYKTYNNLASVIADASLVLNDKGRVQGVGDFKIVGTDTGGLPELTKGGLFIEKLYKFTDQPLEMYVATTGSDANSGFTAGSPKGTVQQAVDAIPSIINNDVVINVADGVYTDIGGQDEFGRGVCIDLSTKTLAILRDDTAPLNDKKAKLIIRGESEAGTIIDGTNNSTTRYVAWCHEVQGIQFETITLRNSYGGVIAHQNADVTLRDVTTSGCDFGRMIESNSRMEVLRGDNTGNIRNYFIKNGQLQENDSNQAAATENGFLIDGSAWIYMLRVDIESQASKNLFESTGAVWLELDDCNVYGGGNNCFSGTYSHIRLSNDTRIGDFTSGVFANEAGYADTDGLCHLYNNNFIGFISKGNPSFNLDNCDSKAATGTHDGAGNSATLTDSTQSWVVDQFVGLTLSNLTDGSSGTITANTATTITATLAGGTDNDWDVSDAYEIEAPNTNGIRLQGFGSSALIDEDCTIISSDKILSRPTGGMVFKGSSPPATATSYYERGAINLNESAADFSTPFWINTAKGYGSGADFEPYAVYGSTTYDAPSIAAGATTTTTVTVTGADLGDFTSCSFGVDLQGLIATSYVSASNTVTVVLYNPTAGAIDLASTTLRAKAGKF